MTTVRRTNGLRVWLLLLVAMFALTPLLAAAQDGAKKNVASIWVMWVKPGHSADFEKAVRQHAQWRKKAGEGFSWQIFQPVAGDDLDHYVVYSGNHAWSEFDANQKWDADNNAGDTFNKQVGPSVDHFSHYFSTDDEDLSYWPDAATSFKLLEVTDMKFVPGKYGDFRKALGGFREAATAEKWSGHWGISSQTGGDVDATVVFPHANYADMAQPTPSFMDMLGKHLGGKAKAMATFAELQASIASTSTTLYLYRPDLSTPSE